MHRRHGPLCVFSTLMLAVGLAVPAAAQTGSRNMDLKSHRDDYVVTNGAGYKYSSCWSYVHQDGREYAILGTAEGTAIYNVTDPVNAYSVGFIPHVNSVWRNMKAYRNWIYIVSEGVGAGEGMQVVSMVDPENPSLVTTYTSTFVLAHTVEIDTARALLYANGTRSKTGPGTYPDAGIRILSLAIPEAPVEVSSWPASGFNASNYAHDSFPINDRLYVASINVGRVRVVDVADSTSPNETANWTYPGAFTHNVWANPTESHVYATDETQGEPVKVFDVTNINSPVLVNTLTPDPNAVLHNVHVRGDELHLAGYTSGARIYDLADPAHPAEFAYADPEPDPSGGFSGFWEVGVYFPSGTVIASDMNTGLYVYRPDRTNYGLVRAEVVQKYTQLPIQGANVHISAQGDSLETTASGIAVFGPSPGAYTISADKFGYVGDAGGVTVSAGSRDTLKLELDLKPTGVFAGTVTDAVSTNPLPTTDVRLAYTPLSQQADGSGDFNFAAVPEDIYLVDIRSPGHVPFSYSVFVSPIPGPAQTIQMHPADIYDDFELPSGWTVGAPGDDATTGVWTRVEPLGTGEPQASPAGAFEATRGRVVRLLSRAAADPVAGREALAAAITAPGDVQPEVDRTPSPGELCYVTGQGTNPNSIGQQDVDNGITSLVSPVYDLSGMTDPYVGFWKWLYTTGGDDDWLAVFISDDGGTSYTPVDTIQTAEAAWSEYTFRVADHASITNQVRVKFVAADLSPGTIVEAGVDDFMIWDDAAVTVAVSPSPAASRLAFRAPHPNPARGAVTLALDLPVAGDAEVLVYDVAGRLVRTLHRGRAGAGSLRLSWDGRDDAGHRVPAGLFFAQARAQGDVARVRFVRVQ